MTKTLIDTNVLFYAFTNQEPAKRIKALNIMNEKIKNKEIILSIQNIIELTRILKEKSLEKISDERIGEYIQKLEQASEIIYYKPETIIKANKINSEYNIPYFDAILIATMQDNQIKEIVTENTKDFKKIPWLTIINPFK